jgi:hypothetical protein
VGADVGWGRSAIMAQPDTKAKNKPTTTTNEINTFLILSASPF